MIDSRIAAFAVVAAALTVTPGADTLLVLKNALRGGRRAGWATMLGILAGTLLHASLSAVGLSVILARSAAAFQIVKLAGAAYLVWLGVQTFRSGGAVVPDGADGLPGATLRGSFGEGFLTNALNPKVAVFYLAFLPQFIRPGDPVLLRSLLLASIHNGMAVVWLGTLSVVAARGRAWMQRAPVRKWIQRTAGAALLGLGVRLALDRR